MNISNGKMTNLAVKLMKQRESENAEDTNQTTDDKKQNERRQDVIVIS
ncbi:hypothetical protein Tsp_05877 [Trichinella spiralis]|nr:hypothetical protein Tsp_05877 [Trichinella spiralis]